MSQERGRGAGRPLAWLALGLGILLAGILFPMDWPGQVFPAYRAAYAYVFSPVWMHLLMHTLLFAGLAFGLSGLARFIQERRGQDAAEAGRTALAVLAGVLLVGVLQELFQGLSRGTLGWAVLPDSLFDLVVDLVGGLLGLGVYAAWSTWHAAGRRLALQPAGEGEAHENRAGGG